MPCKKGSVNYRNNLLIDIIEEILPSGELGWEAIAIAYQGRLNKEAQQDTADIKKHWMKNLCNGMRKLTGHTGENGDRVCWCIAIKKKNMQMTHLGFLGLLSDEENVPNASSVASADEGGVDDDDVSGTRLVVKTSFESDDGNNNGEPPQPPPELSPLDIPRHHAQINASESNGGEETTPHPLSDVNIALRRAVRLCPPATTL
jgi:hypothetical protein